MMPLPKGRWVESLLDTLVPPVVLGVLQIYGGRSSEDVSRELELAQASKNLRRFAREILSEHSVNVDQALAGFAQAADSGSYSKRGQILLAISVLSDLVVTSAQRLAIAAIIDNIAHGWKRGDYEHEVYHCRRVYGLLDSQPERRPENAAPPPVAVVAPTARSEASPGERAVLVTQLCRVLGGTALLSEVTAARDMQAAFQCAQRGGLGGGRSRLLRLGLHAEHVANFFRQAAQGEKAGLPTEAMALSLLSFYDIRGEVMVAGPTFGALTALRAHHVNPRRSRAVDLAHSIFSLNIG